MAVDTPDIIDFASIDLNSNAVLTISDHLEWSGFDLHIYMVQEKINYYLRTVESGALYDKFPDLQNRPVRINLIMKFEPDEAGILFLKRVSEVLIQSGYFFTFSVINENEQL